MGHKYGHCTDGRKYSIWLCDKCGVDMHGVNLVWADGAPIWDYQMLCPSCAPSLNYVRKRQTVADPDTRYLIIQD